MQKSALFLLFLLAVSPIIGFAQRPAASYSSAVPAVAPSDDKVFLIYSDSLLFSRLPDGSEVQRAMGNVRFKHKGTILHCNLAVQNLMTNVIEAYGKVKLVQGDTLTITGDTLFYYGNTRFARVTGKTVILKDQKRTLTTNRIDYDMNTGIAYYPNRGKTIDAENTLSSKQGYYDTRSKFFTYYNDVKLVNKKYTITTDTLFYNSLTKIADFKSLTKVVSKDGTLIAKNGSYNTETGASVFRTRTTIDNPDYTLTGDSITFDNQTKKGFAKGKVELVAKTDDTILNGDFGIYDGKEGKSKVWGHALTRNIADKDTMFMTADTLYSIEIKTDSIKTDSIAKIKTPLTTTNANADTTDKQKPRKLIGNKNVLIYRKDLQAKCDSLIYNTQDSTITFVKKPILWANKYQLEADSIVMQMANQKIKRAFLKAKAFAIAQDSLLNFNQVKGRQITAYFDDSTRLERVFVEGNGESVYFAVAEAGKAMGMNRVECSKMTLNFRKNIVKKILFVGQPDGKFYPPHEIKVEQKSLEGFNWRIEDQPTKNQILTRTNWKLLQPLPITLPVAATPKSIAPAKLETNKNKQKLKKLK
jgi:lipopolysaccharide export system protein LptA